MERLLSENYHPFQRTTNAYASSRNQKYGRKEGGSTSKGLYTGCSQTVSVRQIMSGTVGFLVLYDI